MKRPWFVPSTISLISGALSFVLLVMFAAVASIVVPALREIGRTSPHLAMLGFLGLVVSPAFVVVVVHHVGHRSLDQVDAGSKKRGVVPKVESWWAGAHAWLVLYGTSLLTQLVLLVIRPPEFDDGSTNVVSTLTELANHYGAVANALSPYTMLWVLIAAELFELERRARRRP